MPYSVKLILTLLVNPNKRFLKTLYIQFIWSHLTRIHIVFQSDEIYMLKTGPEVIKLFSMLNSAEHEIYPADKC